MLLLSPPAANCNGSNMAKLYYSLRRVERRSAHEDGPACQRAGGTILAKTIDNRRSPYLVS